LQERAEQEINDITRTSVFIGVVIDMSLYYREKKQGIFACHATK
jgi:hypothetical protein